MYHKFPYIGKTTTFYLYNMFHMSALLLKTRFKDLNSLLFIQTHSLWCPKLMKYNVITICMEIYGTTYTHTYVYIYQWKSSEAQVQRHFNPIEYAQCPEFSTTPVVFISGTTSTHVDNVDVEPLMKTAGVDVNFGHCAYSNGSKCL